VIVGGVKLWHVDTDFFKSRLHSDIRRALSQDDPTWTLFDQAGEDYMRQVTAEELVIKPGGKRVWTVPKSRANHYLDCEVLAAAAAYVHRTKWSRQFIAQGAPRAVDADAAPSSPAALPRPAGGYIQRPQGSYFRR
jgi:phage terminase large subunit GpA-like protein